MEIEPASPASPCVDVEELSAVSSTQSHNTQSVFDSWEWGARHQCRISVQPVQTPDESQCDVGGFWSDDSMKLPSVTTSKKSKSRSTRQRGRARAQRDLLKAQAKESSFGPGNFETRPEEVGTITTCKWAK